MAMLPKGIPINVEIPTTNLPPPQAVNWFHFTQHGGEIQLLAGYIDAFAVTKAQESINAKRSVSLRPDVSHRLVLSHAGFLYLRFQLEDIMQKMKDAGILVVEEPAPKPPGAA